MSEFGNSEYSVTNIPGSLAEVYTAGFLTQSALASFSCRGQSGSTSTGRNPLLSQHSQGSLAQQTQGALMAAGSSSSSPQDAVATLGMARPQNRPCSGGLSSGVVVVGFNMEFERKIPELVSVSCATLGRQKTSLWLNVLPLR